MAPVEEDEETAVAGATVDDEADDDDDTDDDEDEDEDEASPTAEGKFEAYEGRIRRTAAGRLKDYRIKMTASLNERIAAKQTQLDEYVTNKLDEWTMKHAGAGQVQNPERVAESLLRQQGAAEVRAAAIREQLQQLEAAGVDVSSLRAKATAAA
jgi:hypothetical protein